MGTTFWNRLSITPSGPVGEVTHFIGVQSDVTFRRQAEDGLRKAKEALEQDLRLAARVQQALLPPPEMQAGELRIAHVFHPCDDLAGDGVSVVSLPGTGWGSTCWMSAGTASAPRCCRSPWLTCCRHLRGRAAHREHRRGPVGCVTLRASSARLNRQFPMDRTRQYFTLVSATSIPPPADSGT